VTTPTTVGWVHPVQRCKSSRRHGYCYHENGQGAAAITTQENAWVAFKWKNGRSRTDAKVYQ
ncbi:hypothetical protein DAR30_24550, partial [Salmonella enterica subsp. enterica serovar Enteritidis]|nr:hypothetical protein [Salmonella enterica subsp. enterica serovar Enteritidis]